VKAPANRNTSIKQYRMVIIAVIANLVLWAFSPDKARMSVSSTGSIFREILMILPPMFVFVGLIDQWVPREVIERHVGKESGARGMILSMLLGSVTIGPVYAAFPLAAMLLKKGARISNIVAFITVKAAAEVPLVLMESKFMGAQFALVRLGLTFLSAAAIGWITGRASLSWSDAERHSAPAADPHIMKEDGGVS
jgi:uncharacterized membrane protein YraQ (UPF0718 family)